MNDLIRFYSTNGSAARATLAEALLQGLAADRGLFMPERFPTLERADLAALAGKPYPDVAFAVLRTFTVGIFDDATLMALCKDAYDFDVPIEHVSDGRHLMRLDRGPTASFKDFAARMMARWMSVLNRPEEGELVILVATSGDTGSAVAHAYHGLPGVRVVVLFPPAEVSDRQRKQMTTIGGNVTTIGVEGQFDDCQAMVKRAFADPALAGIRLTSANSINIGRLLPQAVYYVYAYVNVADAAAGEPIVFSVPSGNFGDMMGGIIAGRVGVPMHRLVVATNANDEFPVFLRTGEYRPISPSRVCISNAMNVGHPSNLARLVDVYGGTMDETGAIAKPPDLARMRADLYAVSVTDDETRATIRSTHETYGVVLEPHGAVGWAGLGRFHRDCPDAVEVKSVSIETAHPAKFPDAIQAAIGLDPALPRSLSGLEDRPECFSTIKAEYEPFRAWLIETFATRRGVD